MSQSWSLYILECKDGSYYTGITNHVENRMEAHKSKKGSKYVASRLPFRLLYQEAVGSHSEALKREIEVKKMSRTKKLALAHS